MDSPPLFKPEPKKPAAPPTGDPRKLGEILIAEDLIVADQLEAALQEQINRPLYLGQILMRRHWINERDLFPVLSRQRGVEFYDVRDRDIPPEVVDKLPREVAIEHSILPVEYSDGILRVAMEDPLNERLLALITRSVPEPVRAGFTTRGDLHYAINRAYNNLVRSNPLVRDFFDGFAYLIEQPQFDSNRLIDLMLALAHLLGASDVHMTFSISDFRIGLRIDGTLHGIPIPARRLRPEQINQLRTALKIRSGIDTSKKGMAQDGRLMLEMEQGTIQTRVSTLPLVDGEKIVLKLIGQLELREFDELGFDPADVSRIEPLLKRSGGLILVTGPSGSGKTTTLYALLGKIPSATKNLLTIEDPVEARLPFASQIQVDTERSLTYVTALSAMVHQDPDVIMVGELEDRESAALAVERAMTGHLVLSSVQMEHATGAIQQLLSMGVEALSVASALRLIIAQRLVPAICSECRQEHPESAALAQLINLPHGTKLFQGAGCKRCYFTGKSGRIAVFETIYVNDALRDLIAKNPTLTEIARVAKQAGARISAEDAAQKCVQGWLTPEDVLALI